MINILRKMFRTMGTRKIEDIHTYRLLRMNRKLTIKQRK